MESIFWIRRKKTRAFLTSRYMFYSHLPLKNNYEMMTSIYKIFFVHPRIMTSKTFSLLNKTYRLTFHERDQAIWLNQLDFRSIRRIIFILNYMKSFSIGVFSYSNISIRKQKFHMNYIFSLLNWYNKEYIVVIVTDFILPWA